MSLAGVIGYTLKTTVLPESFAITAKPIATASLPVILRYLPAGSLAGGTW